VLEPGLEKRLAAYALAGAAGVLGASQLASAEIVFTPANVTITNSQSLNIDFDHNGTPEVTLSIITGFNPSSASFSAIGLRDTVRIIGNRPGFAKNSYAWAFTRGQKIGQSDHFLPSSAKPWLAYANAYYFYYLGFPQTSNRFLGLRFKVNGQAHYAWVGFSSVHVSFNNRVAIISAAIRGFAYETVPNRTILAGQIKGTFDEAGVMPEDSNGAFSGAKATASAHVANQVQLPPMLELLAFGSSVIDIWRREQDLVAKREQDPDN
jgi:hypothetical protein